eukprot:4293401-Prymnesium_polylepis.1
MSFDVYVMRMSSMVPLAPPLPDAPFSLDPRLGGAAGGMGAPGEPPDDPEGPGGGGGPVAVRGEESGMGA